MTCTKCDLVKSAYISDKIDIQFDRKYQFHYVANSDIVKGTLLLIENHIVEDEFIEKTKNCLISFKPIRNPSKNCFNTLCSITEHLKPRILLNRAAEYHREVRILCIFLENGFKTNPKKKIMYPYNAFFSHDCDPNTFNIEINDKLYIWANRDIKKGEDVSKHYGYSYGKTCVFNCEIHSINKHAEYYPDTDDGKYYTPFYEKFIVEFANNIDTYIPCIEKLSVDIDFDNLGDIKKTIILTN